jgi:hypothetical protein
METKFIPLKNKPETAIEINIHSLNSDNVIINLPGFGGDINGYSNKYNKLAEYLVENQLGAVVRMGNIIFPNEEYGQSIVNQLETVIDFILKYSEYICTRKNPNIYIIGTSAGAGATALVAYKYAQIKKILLVAPAAGNVRNYGNALQELMKFTGDVAIIIGEKDDVVGVGSGRSFKFYAEDSENIHSLKYIEIPFCDHQFKGETNGRILSRAPFWAFIDKDLIIPPLTESCKLYD